MLRLAPDSSATEGGGEGILKEPESQTWRRFPTVSDDAQNGQIHQAFPVRPFLQGNAVSSGGEDVTAADGDQLAAVVSARHVVQHGGVVDESV